MVAIPASMAAWGWESRTSLPFHVIRPSSGWCTPASTLISVDLPAPFWPSRQWTSPARTSRSTPPRALTPGKRLTMPVITSSGEASLPGLMLRNVDPLLNTGQAKVENPSDESPSPPRSIRLCFTTKVTSAAPLPVGPGAPSGAGELLQLMRDGRPRTRGELIAVTGLARSTVGGRVDALLATGLLAPSGEARSTGGRPPVRFAFNPEARVVVGADIGATPGRGPLTDLSGRPICEIAEGLDITDGPEVVLDWLVVTTRRLL